MSTTVGPIGITFHDQYVSTKTYPFLALVTDGGNSYLHIALEESIGKPLPVWPEKKTAFWVLAARRGQNVQLRVTETAVEWKPEDETNWTSIIDIKDMVAARNQAQEYAAAAKTSEINAASSAVNAQTARTEAETAMVSAKTAKTAAESARDEAQTKVNSIAGLTATAITLLPSENATVDVKMEGNHLKLTIGVPEGKQGSQGVPGVSPTITSAKVGKITTVTIVDHTGTKTFTIHDGSDGAGSGDMHTSIYDKNGNGWVDIAEVANSLASSATIDQSQVVGLSATLDTKVNSSDLISHTGNKSNPHGVTAAQVGADPSGTARELIILTRPKLIVITIEEGDWFGEGPYFATKTAIGIVVGNTQGFYHCPTDSSYDMYLTCGVRPLETTIADELTFTATEKPLVDLMVNITLQEVS